MDDITIGVTEFVNNISVSAQPNDQIIDIAVTETVETVLLDVSTTVQEVTVTATQNVIVENITVDYVNNENNIDINVTDATQDVTLNVTPTLVEINILRSGGEVNILQFNTRADFPTTGSIDYFYLAKDTNKLYRWTGSAYAEIAATANARWGEIIGTLSEQTDLQNALNLKAPINSPTFTGTVSGITKGMVGLGAVDNTSDLDKPISTATQTALNAKQPLDADLTSIAALSGTFGLLKKTANNSYTIDTNTYLTGITSSDVTTALGYTPENVANKGVNNGYASLDGGGKVPSSQLPSYVDDVIEVSSFATLPTTGETGKIYITLDTNKIYRWSGSVYVEVSSSAAVWGGITGTLSNQTDLQNALNAKLNVTTAASTYVPYTGATGAVNLGAYDLKVNELTIGKGTSSLSNNTALGHDALFHITTGNYNTGVGHEALHNTTTGEYNTALGQSALFTNTTGGQNTAIGLNALLSNTSGGSNTALGLDSLQHNTTGSSNVALGYNAGSHITGGTTPNTTSGTSIYIGRDTRANANGGSNEIVIGHATTGNGSNSVTIGNSSITANYLKGSVNAGSFVKSGGTSSQFLKADGSVDSSTYLTSASLSGYVDTTTNQSIAGFKTFTGYAQFENGIYIKQDGTLSGIAGYNTLDANTTSVIFSLPNTSSAAEFKLSNLTQLRFFDLPNASGTIALTSDIPSAYTLPTASTTVLGGVKVDGTTITINGSGVISTSGAYTLPTATDTVLGGVKIGSGVTITSGVISVSTSYLALAGGTLTGTVTSNSFIITSSQFAVTKNSSGTSSAFYGFQNTAGTNRWNLSIDNAETGSGNTGFDFNIYRYDDAGATLSSALTIKRSTGNIGIGTSSNASRTLEVAQPSGYSAGIRIIGNTGGDAKIQFLASGASSQPEIGPTVTSPNDLIFGVGGTERLRILSSGNIGIGMIPYINGLSSALDLVGGAGIFGFNNNVYLSANAYFTDAWRYKASDFANVLGIEDGNFTFAVGASGTTGNAISFSTKVTITSAGNVGIGNNASTVRLFVGGSGNTSAAFAFTAGDSGGNTLFSVRNDGRINAGLQSQSPYNFSTSGRSMIVNSSGDVGYLVSTREAKTNINKLEDVSWLYKLNPVSYNYRKRDNDMNYTEDFDIHNWYGLIADEVEKVNKDLVFYNYNNKGQKLAGVEYNNIISALVKGIQDLKVELDTLKNK